MCARSHATKIDDALADLTARIADSSPGAVVRVVRMSDFEATIRVYAPAVEETNIKAATQDVTLGLLSEEGLDIQVLVYDDTSSAPE